MYIYYLLGYRLLEEKKTELLKTLTVGVAEHTVDKLPADVLQQLTVDKLPEDILQQVRQCNALKSIYI